jgi:hypothetical protein
VKRQDFKKQECIGSLSEQQLKRSQTSMAATE